MKFIPLSLFFCLSVLTSFSQAKKPAIMVVPSLDWCVEHGYVLTYDNQGKTETLPDYEKAMMTFPDLNSVMGKIGAEMQKDGFKLADLGQTLNNAKQMNAEENLLGGGSRGTVSSSPIDEIRENGKHDIEFQVYWKIEKQGPRKRVTEFRLKGVDTFTNQQVAYADGSGEWITAGNASDADLLREAVQSKMDGFKASLQTTFEDMFVNGREITVRVWVYDSWGKDLDTYDYGGEELAVLIEEWVAQNAMKGKSGAVSGSELKMYIPGVRIPLYDDNGAQFDGRGFAKKLKKYLISIGIPATEIEIQKAGLGTAFIIFGKK